jgi:hypothetical protein
MLTSEITRGLGLIVLLAVAVVLHFLVVLQQPPDAVPGAADGERGAPRVYGEPSTLRLVFAMLTTVLALFSTFVAVAHAPELDRRLGAAFAAAALFAASGLVRPPASIWRTVAGSLCVGLVAGMIWF